MSLWHITLYYTVKKKTTHFRISTVRQSRMTKRNDTKFQDKEAAVTTSVSTVNYETAHTEQRKYHRVKWTSVR